MSGSAGATPEVPPIEVDPFDLFLRDMIAGLQQQLAAAKRLRATRRGRPITYVGNAAPGDGGTPVDVSTLLRGAPDV